MKDRDIRYVAVIVPGDIAPRASGSYLRSFPKVSLMAEGKRVSDFPVIPYRRGRRSGFNITESDFNSLEAANTSLLDNDGLVPLHRVLFLDPRLREEKSGTIFSRIKRRTQKVLFELIP